MPVGLVIVTFNARAFIERCLAAVAAQTRRPDRVIVIDNASTDGTPAAVEAASRELGLPVDLRVMPRNEGFAAANNRAVAALDECELVALLNPDAFPEPGWLAALVAAAAGEPGAASFASRLMLDGRPGVLDGLGDICHVSGLVWRHGHGEAIDAHPEALAGGPVFSACAAAALYRRADWMGVGGLDERFFCYVEDVDLGFRLQLAGRGCVYVPEAVVHHTGSASAGVGSAFAVYHGHRNMEWMAVKNLPASLLLRYAPLRLASWAAGLLWFARRGRGGPYVRAKWDALTGLGPAWRARRAIQASRVLSPPDVRARLDRSPLWRRMRARKV